MNFKISKVIIENFRAIKNLETDLWDKTYLIGDNESCKTTVASAILWALTGKSVEGESTFEIVPAGQCGKVSPAVTLECMIDDRPVTLKREYKAKYTRDKQFSDYAATTYINGNETGVKKFAEWVSQNICDEKVFKILSNPKTFVEDCPHESKELVWQAQRRMLMSIIGEQKSDCEIAESSDKFKPLTEPLKRYGNATEYLKYLKKMFSDSQKEMDSFDIRIEEQEKNIKKLEHTDEEIEKMVQDLKSEAAEVKAQNEQYKQSQRTGQVNDIQEQISAVEKERDSILDKYNEDLLIYQRTVEKYKEQADAEKAELVSKQQTLKKYAEALDKLRAYKVKDTCEHCGNKLKPAQIESAKGKILERIKNGEHQTAEISGQVIVLNKKWENDSKKVKTILAPTYPAKVEAMNQKIKELSSMFANVTQESDMPDYVEKMGDLEEKMSELKEEFILSKQNKEFEQKIQDIENQHKETVKRMSGVQRGLDLTKDFISEKCQSAEDEINSLFENVRFELFEKNKSNDEIKEVCNMTWNGHKYADLSASTKIVASLELVRAFQKYYNVSVPLVLDNFESVTGDVDTGAQSIYMVVREENCPKCGGQSGRRNKDGTWTCKKCGHVWEKKLEIKEK